MAKKFTTDIDLQKEGELVDTLFHKQTTSEIISNLDTEAQFGYDTDEKVIKYFDGTNIVSILDSARGGQTAFFTWKYSTNPAAADPGNGFFRANNISPASISKLYIDDITSGNQVDISNLFERVKGDWLLHIQQRNDASKWMQFSTSTIFTDNTGWWTLDVTFTQAGTGGGITNLTDCLFTFVNQNSSSTLRRVSKSANYSITRNDYTIECTANSFTVTLPTAIGHDGDTYVIKNSGTGIITVDTSLAQTIDDELTMLLSSKVSITVQSNGTNYLIL